jgi:hypothetical protein
MKTSPCSTFQISQSPLQSPRWDTTQHHNLTFTAVKAQISYKLDCSTLTSSPYHIYFQQ